VPDLKRSQFVNGRKYFWVRKAADKEVSGGTGVVPPI